MYNKLRVLHDLWSPPPLPAMAPHRTGASPRRPRHGPLLQAPRPRPTPLRRPPFPGTCGVARSGVTSLGRALSCRHQAQRPAVLRRDRALPGRAGEGHQGHGVLRRADQAPRHGARRLGPRQGDRRGHGQRGGLSGLRPQRRSLRALRWSTLCESGVRSTRARQRASFRYTAQVTRAVKQRHAAVPPVRRNRLERSARPHFTPRSRKSVHLLTVKPLTLPPRRTWQGSEDRGRAPSLARAPGRTACSPLTSFA